MNTNKALLLLISTLGLTLIIINVLLSPISKSLSEGIKALNLDGQSQKTFNTALLERSRSRVKNRMKRRTKLKSILPEKASITSTPLAAPIYFISGCAKVSRAELPYLIEWLEYHRLTGFDKMILYIDDSPLTGTGTSSLDDFRIISDLYRKIKPDYLEVRSLASVVFDTTAEQLNGALSVSSHRLTQQSLDLHCYHSLREKTEWYVHFDIDEFIVIEKAPSGPDDNAQSPIRLRDWLKTLYPRADCQESDELREVQDMYLTNNLAGIYIPSLNYGLGEKLNLFNPKMQFTRDPILGTVKILHANNLPTHPDVHDTRSIEDRTETLKEILYNATNYQKKAPDMLDDILKFNHSRPIDRTPSILATLTRAMPSHRLLKTSWLNILKVWIKTRPSCELSLSKLPEETDDAAHNYLTSQKRVGCRGGALDSKYTGMGKTLLWTGRRFAPPSWHQDLVSEIIAIEAHKMAQLKSASMRGKLKEKRKKIEKLIRGGMVARLKSLQPFSRRETVTRGDVPHICRVPWIHGCAHKTTGASIMFGPPEIRLNHYMIRSLESRTAGDAGWRKGASGWGKLNDMKIDLEVLSLTNAVPRPPPQLANSTQDSINANFGHLVSFREANYTQALRNAWPRLPTAPIWLPKT